MLGVVAASRLVADLRELEGDSVSPLRSIRPMMSPTRLQATPSGLMVRGPSFSPQYCNDSRAVCLATVADPARPNYPAGSGS